MSSLGMAAVLLIAAPWLALASVTAVLLLNRAPGRPLPLLPWWPSWDPDVYDDIGQRWLPWHKRATVAVLLGMCGFAFDLWLGR